MPSEIKARTFEQSSNPALTGMQPSQEVMARTFEQSSNSIFDWKAPFQEGMARPERFELPTLWFVATRSIQLSYGRIAVNCTRDVSGCCSPMDKSHFKTKSIADDNLAEREGFEPSMGF